MVDFEQDRKKEKELDCIIDYFKLVYIERLTKDRDYATFKMLDGDKIFERLEINNEEGLFSFSTKNFDLLNDLKNKLGIVLSSSYSLSYKKQFTELDWLTNVMEYIDINERVYDSLINNASYDVLNVLNEKFSNKVINPKQQDKLSAYNKINNIVDMGNKHR